MFSLPSPWALMSGPVVVLLLLLSLPPPQDATTSASASTANTTAPDSTARLLFDSRFIRSLLGCADYTGVTALPDESHLQALQRLGVLVARARVLSYDHELS